MYKNFLEKNTEYEKIFCTDIRDVIFQGDLFSSYADYKNFLVYATHPYKIQNEPTNTKWIRHIFSENEYQKIKDNFVICAGVVYGSRSGMDILLDTMVKMFKQNSEWGDDQAAYNYLNYSFKNFIKDMLIQFTDIFYKNNQQNNAREYIKRLANWRD